MSETRTPEPPAPSPDLPDAPDNPELAQRGGPQPPGGVLGALVRQQSLVVPLIALVAAFAIGAVIIRIQGVAPLFAYQTLFKSALGTHDGLLLSLQNTTPLILAGLAVAIPLRVGLFNIGGQGQVTIGGLAAAIMGFKGAALPAVILIPASLLFGIVAGAAWASIAGLLKTTRGVHEVIATIMLNSIADQLIDYLVNNPFNAPGNQGTAHTPEVATQGQLPNLSVVPTGFVIAVVLALAGSWMLRRTTLGFKFDTVGANRDAARYAGVNINRMVLLSMVFAGGLAGLAGSVQALGVIHRYEPGFGGSIGFDGITIALLARGNPLGTVPAALLVGVLRAGAATLQFNTGIQPEIVDMIMAITLLFVSLPVLGKLIFRRYAASDTGMSTSWGS